MQNLSEQDYELISAYLDNELSASERAAFDVRLAQEPGLRAELEELRVVRSAVQALPALRAPRRFTLTPQMVGQAAAAPPRRVLRPRANWWLSAAAALVVTLVGVGVLLVSRNDQPPGGNQQIAALASATPESTTEMTFAAQPPLPSPAPTQMIALTTPAEGALAGVPAPQGTSVLSDTLAGDLAASAAASASGSAEASSQAGDPAQTARALPTDTVPEAAQIFTFDAQPATSDSTVMQMALPEPAAAETGMGDAALSTMMTEPDQEQMALVQTPKSVPLADHLASLLRIAAALVAALWSLLHP